jgi:hypothetical protein
MNCQVFEIIATETLQVFHLATSCSFIIIQHYFMLLYATTLPVSEYNITHYISKHKRSRKSPYKYPQQALLCQYDSSPLLPIDNASKMDT